MKRTLKTSCISTKPVPPALRLAFGLLLPCMQPSSLAETATQVGVITPLPLETVEILKKIESNQLERFSRKQELEFSNPVIREMSLHAKAIELDLLRVGDRIKSLSGIQVDQSGLNKKEQVAGELKQLEEDERALRNQHMEVLSRLHQSIDSDPVIKALDDERIDLMQQLRTIRSSTGGLLDPNRDS